jgi:hypothetical protein
LLGPTIAAVPAALRTSPLDDRFHESDSMLGVLSADSHFVASSVIK